MEDCNEGCKEIERIETLAAEVKAEIYSMCNFFKDIVNSKIIGLCTSGKNTLSEVGEPVSGNKIDRIMLDLHKAINTLKEFKKINLAELEKQLERL